MYLKSLEIQGFKSFANKINFEFHNGITAIVGPNGSGKSNISDAVRWVLGEQKLKQLRGARMEDVIFSGTESRKALGFAYVAITLDNSDHKLAIDFKEVMISRRIFRSGESEYKINGSICRLKDINELFYDTGVGKDGYSIIGQGQIDKILSGKPEERRELFDEAAGIVKFKRRKAISMKKLEEEGQNLTRVKDILSELELQIKPLESQSETAKKFLQLKDDLKIYDVNIFLREIKDKKEKIQKLDEKYNIVSGDIETTKEDLQRIKIQYQEISLLIEELTNTIEDKRKILNDSILAKEKTEGEINVISEQINSVKVNDSHINDRISDIESNLHTQDLELNNLMGKKKDIEDETISIISEQNDNDEELKLINSQVNDLTSKIEGYKSEIIEVLNEKSNVRTKIQRYETILEQIDKRRNELNEQITRFNTDKDKQDQYYEELKDELDKITQSLKERKILHDEKAEEISKISNANNNLNRNYQDTLNKYNREETKLESLKNLTERYEGYGNSIRKVMELKDSKKGIIGVVADIIKVEKEYETAIETCLGGSIQNIVTDSEKTAKDIIEYLKKNKFGRATFLPLGNIANRTGFNNERALSEKGVIGLASDLVLINKEYEAISKYLLGRIIVVDNINNALSLSRKFNYTLRIVTLDGELLNVGGSMTGGAYKNTSNLLGRRREIDDISKSIKLSKNELQELKADIDKNESIMQDLKEEIEEIKIKIQEETLLENTIEINRKQVDIKKQELLKNYDSIHKESDEISIQINDIQNNSSELNDILKSLEFKNREIEDNIISLTEKVELKKIEEANQAKINEDLRLKYSGIIQNNSYIQDNINRVLAEIKKSKNELDLILQNQVESTKEIEEKQGLIISKKEKIKLIDNEIEKLEKEIEEFSSNKDIQSKDHKEYLENREHFTNRLNDLDKELFRLETSKEKIEESYENQINYIWYEYELTYNSAMEIRTMDEKSLSDLKKGLDSIKQNIRKLGDVNVNAIDEYKSVLERYEFLKTQHDDLIRAEEALRKIIKELDHGMKKQFTEKFSIIKEEFDNVFKELFGGGKGTIELVEDEDVLDAGIRIIAQPPGKKLQNIMQLSGGEKALTAISLLFAIQNLKPSPFCLLDEIEAALDDSNVIRFSDYLHKLKEFTQFIVITHRKGTMASADRLYGITMQEKGVSTLVSVNLLEKQLQA